MKKVLFIGLVFCFQSLFSQVSLSGNKLVKDGQTYKLSQYEQVFSKAEASEYFKKGRSNKTAGDVISSIGGFGLGLSLGLIISSPKDQNVSTPNGPASVKTDNSARWAVLGASAGIALASIPFYLGAKKNFDKAIQTENADTAVFQPFFKLENAGTSLALSYNF